MIEVKNLSMVFPDKKLFESVNLSFKEGNTYGIIGANGAGKSTFLKIVAGEVEATHGEIHIESGRRVSVLSQERDGFDEQVVTRTVIEGNHELHEIEKKKNAIYENPDATEKDYEEASKLEEIYGEMGGWNAEKDAQSLLDALGIAKESWEKQMKQLKANEKVKVLLARALFGDPDILIMDEPTNRLDLKAIKWLEEFLADYKKIVIVVSHDSEFLDNICTNIIDIDFGKAQMFTGNYSFWKESSELARELTKQQNLKKEEKIAKLKAFIARFSANASKASQASSRKKALEKIVIEEIKPSTRRYPYIRFDLSRKSGKQVLEVKNLAARDASGNYLFKDLTFTLMPEDKMVVVGPDDLAKTKLLDILAGVETNYEGTINWGTTITTSYFPINNSNYFENEESILEWTMKIPLDNTIAEWKDNSDFKIRSYLGRMLFSADSVFKKVRVTSGGEKARLMFTRMMLLESNFLIFDQPLDHLDTESIDSFIDATKRYQGNIIFTTYNKALIKEAANVILEINGDNSKIFLGDLEHFEKTW